MPELDTGRFTVAVFKDVAWAAKGLDALKTNGFPADSLSILAKEGTEAATLIEGQLGAPPARVDVKDLGSAVAAGPLVAALDGADRGLGQLGLAVTMKRVGFQPHDGQIFAALTARGGVLVAVRTEPRAADALAVFFSYGGANAAIGAWTGRV